MHTQPDELGAGKEFARSVAAFSILCAGFLAGCANPGPPRPPSLHLPAMVDDLSAERVGDQVLLRWITPSRTTDGLDVKGAMTAEICRSVGPLAANTKKSLAACAVVKRLPAVAGPSSARDDLPPSLLTDPVTLLTYRIEILNASGRSAGRSATAAFAAAGTSSPPVSSLTATASEVGAVLRWKKSGSAEMLTVDLARTDLSAPGPPRHKTSPAAPSPLRRARTNHADKAEPAEPIEVHLRANPAGAATNEADSLTGTVDTSAMMGETYSYVAQQVRLTTIAGHSLEIRSQPSPAVTLAMRDTFPPKIPTGLATIPGTTEAANGFPAAAYIDLSWEPNTETDLAGYFVYRQLARPNGDPEGPLGKMTASPLTAPAYRDVAVRPGQRYIYHVTAVDASGNESAPSAKAQEVADPQNVVGSPQ